MTHIMIQARDHPFPAVNGCRGHRGSAFNAPELLVGALESLSVPHHAPDGRPFLLPYPLYPWGGAGGGEDSGAPAESTSKAVD